MKGGLYLKHLLKMKLLGFTCIFVSLIFYRNLGIDDIYFSMESSDNIASNIMSLYGAKIQSFTKNKDVLDIDYERIDENGAVIMCTSTPGVSSVNGPQYEKRYHL